MKASLVAAVGGLLFAPIAGAVDLSNTQYADEGRQEQQTQQNKTPNNENDQDELVENSDSAGEQHDLDDPESVTSTVPTESLLDPMPAELPDGFTESLIPSEETLADLVISDDEKPNAHVARADLASDIAVIGATWAKGGATPSEVLYRHLDGDTWSEWGSLEFEETATEPTIVTNSSAVELIAKDQDGEGIPGLEIVVIDPRGEAEVTNTLADEGNTQAARDAEQEQSEQEETSEKSEEAGRTSSENTNPEATETGETGSEEAGPEETGPKEAGPEETGSEPVEVDPADSGAVEPEATNPDASGSNSSDADTSDPEVAGSVDSQPSALELSGQELSDMKGTAFAKAASYSASTITVSGTKYSTGFHGLVVNTRKGWRANEGWMNWPAERVSPKGVIVHHTAGSTNYTKAQVPGVIQGIYSYHARTLNWGDVGYNFLVDKYGGVWEGRTGSIKGFVEGGHAYGANRETVGISVLGTYESAAPPAVAQDAVAKVAGWKLMQMGVKDASKTISLPQTKYGYTTSVKLPAISGHRDVNATSCPGHAFYARLGAIRTAATKYIKTVDPDAVADVKTTTRTFGDDRYETAVLMSEIEFQTKADTVYLASGDSPVDAMVAGTVTDGPVLLVHTDSVPKVTSDEIARLKPKRVVAVGGTDVISKATLAEAADGRSTKRLSGDDRMSTAVAVSKYVFPNGADSVYVADALGADLKGSPDAVSGANVDDGPILLTKIGGKMDAKTAAETKRLKPTNKFELGAKNLKFSSKRLAGDTRFGTSAEIASRAYKGKVDTVYLLRSDVLIDAVAAGPLTGGPRVLIGSTSLHPDTCSFLADKQPSKLVVVGSSQNIVPKVVSEAQECAGF